VKAKWQYQKHDNKEFLKLSMIVTRKNSNINDKNPVCLQHIKPQSANTADHMIRVERSGRKIKKTVQVFLAKPT